MLLSTAAQAADDVRIPENRVIYEVFVRNFSPAGNFAGVEAQIPRLKELGVDVIWLMPIYKLGDIGKWGTYSSPYAIKDYKAIDPDNGDAAQLHSLVNTIHAYGMEIWFDWVGNHTSKDNVWVSSHPEYYGNNFYSPNGWNDVYQLDVNNAAMHEAMIDAMQYWVTEFDIDGYRCDYASGPSEEFWAKATSRVLKNGRRIAWLAEDDSKPQLVSRGYFDYNYAWYFHDRLLDFARGGNVSTLRQECANLHNEDAYKGRSRMVYLSNHDVVQDKGGTESVHFHKYLRPLTVLQFTVYGMPLLYNGQEIKYQSGAVMLSEKTPIDWSRPDTEMTALIKTLCTLKHTQPALRTGAQHGSLTNLTTGNDNNIYVYKRTLQSSNVVVMLNFSDSRQSFTVNGGLPSGKYTDVFSGKSVDMANPGTFTLDAQGYAVYVADDDAVVTPPEPVTPHYAYVEDNTGWTSTYIYAYNESTGEIDDKAPFGSWPGALLTGSYNIDGRTYKRIEIPQSMQGHQYYLIFNNNDKLQTDGPLVTVDGDLTVNNVTYTEPDRPVEPGDHYYIYLENNTGWDKLSLYAWGDAEVFGTWPGSQPSGTYTVANRTYTRVQIPDQYIGASVSLIANNGRSGNGDSSNRQYDLAAVTLDRDLYFTLGASSGSQTTPPREYHIYVVNNSGWAKMGLYGWAEGQPEVFGAWPGALPDGQQAINGRVYDRYTIPADYAGKGYNIIVNNYVADGGDKLQYDLRYMTLDRDYYLTLGSHEGPAGLTLDNDTRYVFFHNIAGWDNVYVYATVNTTARAAATEPFGPWPGTPATDYVRCDDHDLHMLAFPADTHGTTLDITVHNNSGADCINTVTVSADRYIDPRTTTFIDNVAIGDSRPAPVYYNLGGMRVDNPGHGLYIEVRGSEARKVRL